MEDENNIQEQFIDVSVNDLKKKIRKKEDMINAARELG